MTFTDTLVLATAWINQPALGQRAARTLLVGAATLKVRHRFGSWSFDLESHATTVTDNPADTVSWLADQLWSRPGRLLLWRAEDTVVPSLIAAADSARDTVVAAKLLRQLDETFAGEVIDVAGSFGGAQATSFDAIAHAHDAAFAPLGRPQLEEAFRTSCYGAITDHLAARVVGMWTLWSHGRDDRDELTAATDAWLASAPAEAVA